MKFRNMLAVSSMLTLLAPVALRAQTNQVGNYSFVGAANTAYQIDYLGSGGAAYWNSLWAVRWNGSSLGQMDLLYCKDPGCASNNWFGTQQTVFEASGTDSYASAYQWILGFYIETNGVADPTPDTGLWLYSVASLNPGGATFLHDWGSAGVYQDGTYTTLIPGTQRPGWDAIGLEDIVGAYPSPSDRDFNDAVFSINTISRPQTVVPEPMTMTLLATGLVGLSGASLRKRNRKS